MQGNFLNNKFATIAGAFGSLDIYFLIDLDRSFIPFFFFFFQPYVRSDFERQKAEAILKVCGLRIQR